MTYSVLFQKRFTGVVWNSLVSNDGSCLVLDVRDEDTKAVEYFHLNLENLDLFWIKNESATWWSAMEAYDDQLFLSEYGNKNDPNIKKFYRMENGHRKEISAREVPRSDAGITIPFVYEPGSDYFKTVVDFLGLELPCACEYLEFEKKIILCYYLRSGKEFERYLLVLEDGKKVSKELLDTRMKGFASGSFFVLNGMLIFIKNRNEIFVCTI